MPTTAAERAAELDQGTRSRAMYAEVAEAPTSTTDLLYITVPTFDGGEHRFGPCVWQPRVDDDGSVLLPRKGTPCAYVDDEDGDIYIVAWWDLDATQIGGGGIAGPIIARQYDQNTPANPWVINHNLGRIPIGMETFDGSGIKIEGDIVNTNLNQTTITFSGIMSGKATYI